MIEYGLKKAAAVSFAAHIALILATLITIGRTPSFKMPSAYTVRLVSPDSGDSKSSRVPPAKINIPLAKEETPAATEKASQTKTMKLPPEKTTKLKDYSDEKIAALRAQKEQQQYKEEQLHALQAKQKLAKVNELGASKAKVSISTKTSSGSGEQGEGSIMGDYFQQVASLVDQEWVLPGSSREGLYAIITVKVYKDGTLKVAGIQKSSNDALFDRAALRAIEKASPVPPPPYEMEMDIGFNPLQ